MNIKDIAHNEKNLSIIMEKNLVSVITPTYNRGEVFKETIQSVLNQTYHNFEYIIVDDGSTDNTKEIVQSFHDKRIKYINQQHVGTPASGRNTGIKNAKGEFIAFLDSDDIWFPQKLEIQLKEFQKNADILIVATNGIIIPLRPYRNYLSIKKNLVVSFRDLIVNKKNPIINSTVLIKRTAIEAIGLIDEEPSIRALEDYDYWLRVLKYCDNSILVLAQLLVKYRVHSSGITTDMFTNSNFFKKLYERLVYVHGKYEEYDPELLNIKIRESLYRFRVFKTKESLFQRKVNINYVLNDKFLKIYDRLWIAFGYFNDKHLKAINSNYIIGKLNNYLIYFKHKLLT
ncbi:MAG: glycosyltransferase [Candidatus Lokiarchaeota archaeon]|nr:glycosyltransferase [Candidatus Lokiarchaeota archaeon]